VHAQSAKAHRWPPPRHATARRAPTERPASRSSTHTQPPTRVIGRAVRGDSMRSTTRLAMTAASLVIAIGLAGCSAQQSTRSDQAKTSSVQLVATAAAAPLRELAMDEVPKPSSKPARWTPTSPAPQAPSPAAAPSPRATSAAPTPSAAIPVPSRTTTTPKPAPAPARVTVPEPAPTAARVAAPKPTPAPAPVALPKPAPVPAPVATPVSNAWQISIGGWARTIVSGTQSAIDACGPAVLYSSSWPGAGGTTWLNGHNNCGF